MTTRRKTMKRLLILGAVGAVAAVVAAPVLACGGGWIGENLVATPKVKTELRAAYLEAYPGARVGAPAAGRTYYGSWDGTRYAVATFGRYPTIFRTDRKGVWHVRRETHGGICADVVPVDLLSHHWWLKRYDDRCYVLPG
jgi:hypothetical protein